MMWGKFNLTSWIEVSCLATIIEACGHANKESSSPKTYVKSIRVLVVILRSMFGCGWVKKLALSALSPVCASD